MKVQMPDQQIVYKTWVSNYQVKFGIIYFKYYT